jgi:hypothetical protein
MSDPPGLGPTRIAALRVALGVLAGLVMLLIVVARGGDWRSRQSGPPGPVPPCLEPEVRAALSRARAGAPEVGAA